MRYAVVIEKANGNFSAYVPDLPGCVATGSTVQAVETEIRDAIRFHIDGLKPIIEFRRRHRSLSTLRRKVLDRPVGRVLVELRIGQKHRVNLYISTLLLADAYATSRRPHSFSRRSSSRRNNEAIVGIVDRLLPRLTAVTAPVAILMKLALRCGLNVKKIGSLSSICRKYR